jgi:hypothetical protein
MNLPVRLPIFCAAPLLALSVWAEWWEQPHDKWYLKDDWRAAQVDHYAPTFPLDGAATGGWVVVWGDQGVELNVNGATVMREVDRGLIYNADLAPFVRGAREIKMSFGPGRIVAEGELTDEQGRRYPFASGCNWKGPASPGTRPASAAKPYRPGPSSGAFDVAHNGLLLRYNDEERGKSALSKTLARIQRLREQSLFLLRRSRPAEEILSLSPETLWRRAERFAAGPAAAAEKILREEAIPSQKDGQFTNATALAGKAATLLASAELAVQSAREVQTVERQIQHYTACAAMLGLAPPAAQSVKDELDEAWRLMVVARYESTFNDWATVQKHRAAAQQILQRVRPRLMAPEAFWPDAPDEFPEDRFAWLNAADLMGNDPAAWPFTLAPSSAASLDLGGLWEFRVDPENEGEEHRWAAEGDAAGWRTLFAPKPWERQGVLQDNPRSPADAPYQPADARSGDKPYNGFAWYRKRVRIPAAWAGRKIVLAAGRIQNWGRVFLNGQPVEKGAQNPPAEHELPGDLIRFGQENLVAIQVYNHDNFGGILDGVLRLSVQGEAPELIETPGPLSLVREYNWPPDGAGPRLTLLAGAMSPAVLAATDQPAVELWGWEARGYAAPTNLTAATSRGIQRVGLDRGGDLVLNGQLLSENWIRVQGPDSDALIVLERRPLSITWKTNSQEVKGLTFLFESGPARAGILAMPAGLRLDEIQCRYWARILRRYPVAASECTWSDRNLAGVDPLLRRHTIRYRYLDLDGFGDLPPMTSAPVPMLFSYGLEHRHPYLQIGATKSTGYRSEHAPYRVVENTETVQYRARAVDRSRVMKGIGELFAKPKPEWNARGGVTEEDMFRRMGDWGFDHCRYAFAFQADWDLPLVKHVGGPLLEDTAPTWERLDQLVDRANRAGMQMMLCWFFNEDAPQSDTGGAVRNSTRYWRAHPETKTNVLALWKQIAARYADRPDWAVAYDFLNEPAYMNPDHWNALMPELTATVRSVDGKHLIVWESADGWAQPEWCAWMKPVKDPNVLYSFHHYGKHWGYARDEYYPGYQSTAERTQIGAWLEAILFSIRNHAPIHCGEFGLSMIQPGEDGEAWLDDYLAFFERFGIGWNWWNYSGNDVYRTGLCAGDRVSPFVPVLQKWIHRSGRGMARLAAESRPAR